MTMVQWNSGCGYYFPSKMGLKKSFLPQQLDCRFGRTANVTSLKVTWNEGPDKAPQRKRLSF